MSLKKEEGPEGAISDLGNPLKTGYSKDKKKKKKKGDTVVKAEDVLGLAKKFKEAKSVDDLKDADKYGLLSWVNDYLKAKEAGNKKTASELLTSISKDAKIRGINVKELLKWFDNKDNKKEWEKRKK